MKNIKQWLAGLLPRASHKRGWDAIDETSQESFPASDPPAWAGSEHSAPPTLNRNDNHDPVAILKEEHRAIMKVVYLIHEQIQLLEQNQPLKKEILQNIIHFMRQFVESTHHQKEENYFFPALEKSGAPLADCPLALFKEDHELSRALLTTLEKLLPSGGHSDTAGREKLMEILNKLKDIYTRHTLKEENFLFPLAEKYLSPGTQKSLADAFEKIDHGD